MTKTIILKCECEDNSIYWDYTDKYRNEDIAKHLGFNAADCVFMEEHSSMVRVSSFSVC